MQKKTKYEQNETHNWEQIKDNCQAPFVMKASTKRVLTKAKMLHIDEAVFQLLQRAHLLE